MMHPTRRQALMWLAAAASVAVVGEGRAAVPNPPMIAALILKILSYDRALKCASQEPLTVGVTFLKDTPASSLMGMKLIKLLTQLATERGVTVHGRPVTCIPLPKEPGLPLALTPGQISAMVVEAHLGGEVRELGALARRLCIPTICPRPEWIQHDLAIALNARAAPAEIHINLETTRAVGMKLDPRLLEIAHVI